MRGLAEEVVEEVKEKARELGERAEAVLKKLGEGLEYVAQHLEKRDIPKLTRNLMVITTGAMTLYTMGVAIATMLPTASVVFGQLGVVLGYMIPIMINVMIFSLMIGLVKILLR